MTPLPKLTPARRRLVKLAHVASSATWVGLLFALLAVAVDMDTYAALRLPMSVMGVVAALASFVSGAWLSTSGSFALLRKTWVQVKIAITGVVAVVAVIAPLFGHLAVLVGGVVNLTLLFLAAYLSIVKPFDYLEREGRHSVAARRHKPRLTINPRARTQARFNYPTEDE